MQDFEHTELPVHYGVQLQHIQSGLNCSKKISECPASTDYEASLSLKDCQKGTHFLRNGSYSFTAYSDNGIGKATHTYPRLVGKSILIVCRIYI